MSKKYSLTPWTIDGFAEQPVEKPVIGGETIYRAYGGSSSPLGNCFFAPAIGSIPLGYWTAELLEMELNASLWGNDFSGVTKFEMLKVKGAKYRIGSIAHNGYAGVENGQLFTQRSFFTPSGIFKQIKFLMEDGQGLTTLVKKVGSQIPLPSGRYFRRVTKKWQ